MKRLVDIVVSAAGLVVLSPLILFVMYKVRVSSPGPVFYTQERVGLKGRKFMMLKFRSMILNAEPDGPRLSHENDSRITSWGAIMRKWKLDELPQLWNVLKGEMSLVGPRPEREYFIRQIEKQDNNFKSLLEVKPGLTSLGIVKCGYAATIEEMIYRMQFDIVYLKEKSLWLDIRIIIDTVVMILKPQKREYLKTATYI